MSRGLAALFRVKPFQIPSAHTVEFHIGPGAAPVAILGRNPSAGSKAAHALGGDQTAARFVMGFSKGAGTRP